MASFRFPVDRTAILMFASSLGETNRAYYDERYALQVGLGGVIAPPSFPIASAHWNPDFGLKGVRRIPAPEAARVPPEGVSGKEGSTEGETGSLSRLLHGEQRFEYHKPLHPGAHLTVTTRPGKAWVKEGRRGGKLRFSESISEYRDDKGELVVTATSVGILTEKAVE